MTDGDNTEEQPMKCPRCGAECDRDEVDIGVGVQGGPWGCPDCHWIEGQADKETRPSDMTAVGNKEE